MWTSALVMPPRQAAAKKRLAFMIKIAIGMKNTQWLQRIPKWEDNRNVEIAGELITRNIEGGWVMLSSTIE